MSVLVLVAFAVGFVLGCIAGPLAALLIDRWWWNMHRPPTRGPHAH